MHLFKTTKSIETYPETTSKAVGLVNVLGEDASCQTVHSVICSLDHLERPHKVHVTSSSISLLVKYCVPFDKQ